MKKTILITSVIILLLMAACVPPATPTAQIIPLTVTAPPAEPIASPIVDPTVVPGIDPSDTPSPAQPEATSEAGIQVVDALGRQVTLAQPPQRVVLAGRAVIMLADAVYLFPGVSEAIVGLGKTDQGNGNFIAQIDPAYADKEAFTNDVGPEQVAAVKPDLVILKSVMAETLGKGLEVLNIPVIYVDLENMEQYQKDLLVLGKVFGQEERALALTQWMVEEVERIETLGAAIPAEENPRVLLLNASEKEGVVSFSVAPKSYIQTWMVQTAGAEPVWLDVPLEKSWTQTGLEQIARWNPDQVYIISYNGRAGEFVQKIYDDANWAELPVVQNKQVFAFPTDYYSWDQPDIRWLLGLKWLSAMIAPAEQGQEPLLTEVKDFYTQMYGMTDVQFEEIILPRLSGIDLP